MRPQFRSEFIKLTSTRTVYGLLVGATAVVALGTYSTISSAGAANLTGEVHTQHFFIITSVNLAVFAVILGVRSITDEFRHGTMVASVVGSGRRGRLIATKATVAGLGAAVLAALAQTAMVGLALTLSTNAGGALRVSSTDVAAMAGLATASALWAVIGVGVGALVRHQVAAIVGVLVWVLVVENLGASLMGDLGPYLPGQAAHGLARLPDVLAVPQAAAVMTAYTAVAVLAAAISTARRDL